ncbi:hydrolase [Legionella worsleiensis]|uniref:YcaC related amidohydrolase n=1 Tax=Legionella worsleiensis TaxID=45076 RepID=A0A0W1A405_9GAMM|nr:hydrolase [Legionella worsleiensis]KTD76026.1 YcaC related amidohydrolase [Legionella worsleiensis]STY33040.1 YcaC like amidohydrolase [Legionella worsleiensis]
MLLKQKDSILALIDVQQKLLPLIANHEPLVQRCEWLLRLAKKLDVPIIVSEQYPKGLGNTVELLNTHINKGNIIEKVHFSCMQQPDYIQRLSSLNKKQVVLIGIEAHVCVFQTAMEMNDAGYEVYAVVDAVGSRNDLDKSYALKRMKQAGIHLVTSEMVFFEWIRVAGTPEFKALSYEFLH